MGYGIASDDALDEAIKTFKTDSAHMGGKRGVTFWPFINSKLELTIWDIIGSFVGSTLNGQL